MKRKIGGDVVAAAIGLAILAVFTLLRVSASHAAPSFPSTYDTGRNGYAALYEMLGREHLTVRRFESPIGELPARNVALVVAGEGALDAVASSNSARAALNAWIRAGNTLYVLGAVSDAARTALGAPAFVQNVKRSFLARTACGVRASLRGAIVDGDFANGFAPGCQRARAALLRAAEFAPAIAYRRGKGTVVFATTPTPLDNWDLSRHANARFAYEIFSGNAAVAFDERPYGYAEGRTFWQVLSWPVRAAILLTAAAVLLALAGANIPFAPPYSVPEGGTRDSSTYIASLAHLLLRAQANAEIVGRLTAAAESMLKTRAHADARAGELRLRAQELRSKPHPDARDVLASGELFAAVRKDYG